MNKRYSKNSLDDNAYVVCILQWKIKTKPSMVIATYRKLTGRKFKEGHTLYPGFTNYPGSVLMGFLISSQKLHKFTPGTQPWALLPFPGHHTAQKELWELTLPHRETFSEGQNLTLLGRTPYTSSLMLFLWLTLPKLKETGLRRWLSG